MPYICLARNDIQDGTLQVLDLLPNSSQAIPSLNPPGETRYVNRVKTDIVPFCQAGNTGVLDAPHVDGLGAYLVDTVEPGGVEQATGQITIFAGLAAGETVTINGVTFTAVNGVPNPALQEFQDIAGSGSIANTVTSLVATITNAASIALMKLGTISGSYAHATAASPNINLVARTGAGSTLTGWAGDMPLSKSGTHIAVGNNQMERTHPYWMPATQEAVVAALLNRLDLGLTLALGDINTILSNLVGADLSGTNGNSRSYGSVEGILACLAGRTYRIPQKDTTNSANPADVSNGFFVYYDLTFSTKWIRPVGHRGGFTQPVRVNGEGMYSGEIKPGTIGGDVEYREVGGIRQTYNTDALTASLVVGQLSHLTTSTLLWPSSGGTPYFPFGPSHYQITTAPRLVTVYDDNGSVLG